MLFYLSKFFLLFSNAPILVPLILIGLMFYRRYFLIPTLLLLLTMVLSPMLKSIFAIPYPPELVQRLGKEGFSFPSGHMQNAAAFYGWLAISVANKWLRAMLISIITGVGFALIYEGYHNVYDILGGVFFAAITIALGKIAVKQIKKHQAKKELNN